ncbi:DgyrCDS4772 [Dimorphilus gyrociliatus]|uniref:DgyrCDS4772 n=1 Tax=Dimorphilus gyrociliatus TaxID=2664684 RepID=A0A7I8VKL4_9ANNE|nr:DgyrCDS4772 [Dimorphilus gyrociliatus]
MTGGKVCQFFLQGKCKYGDNCWNVHSNQGGPFGGKSNNQGPFGGKQNNVFGGGGFGNKNNNPFNRNQSKQVQTIKDMSTPEIIDHVKSEMNTWEQSKMWPFSCFSISKDLPTFPELNDMSPEELRAEAYEAQATNSFPAYQQKFSTLAAEFTKKRNQLKNPDHMVKQNLTKVIESQLQTLNNSSQSSGGSNIFGQTVFGQTSMQNQQNASSTLFGKPAPSTGGFGQPAPSTGGFGQPAPNTGGFGQPANSFLKPAAASGGFGQPSSFGSLNPTPAQSTIGFQTPGKTFGSSPQQPVQPLQPAAPLQQTPPTNLSFGGMNQAAQNPIAQNPIAQSQPAQNTALPNSSSTENEDPLYSKLSALNPDELRQFQASEFSLDSLPLKPPPKELCTQMNRFLLPVVSKPLAQEIKYGSKGCMSNSTLKLPSDDFCSKIENKTECIYKQINGSESYVCEWGYTGQGVQYEIVAGTAFIVIYTFAGIPLGSLADRYNRKIILSIAIFVWSVATVLTGVIRKYWQLVLLRFLLGIGEAGCTPFAISIISDYFHTNVRGTAIGVYNWGLYMGYSLAFTLGDFIVDLNINGQGWRWVFILGGLPGVVLSGIILLSLKEPKRGDSNSNSSQTSDEQSYDELDNEDEPLLAAAVCKEDGHIVTINENKRFSQFLSAVKVFLRPSLLLLLLAGSIRNSGGYVWAFNTQPFFESLGQTRKQIGTFMSWIPLVGGSLGVLFGGLLSDLVVKRYGTYMRLAVLIVSQILAAPFAAGALWLHTPLAYFSLIPSNVIGEIFVSVALVVVVELVPSNLRSLSVAIYLFVITNIGGNAPLLVPVVQKALEKSFDKILALRITLTLLFPGVYVLGSIFFLLTCLVMRREVIKRRGNDESEAQRHFKDIFFNKKMNKTEAEISQTKNSGKPKTPKKTAFSCLRICYKLFILVLKNFKLHFRRRKIALGMLVIPVIASFTFVLLALKEIGGINNREDSIRDALTKTTLNVSCIPYVTNVTIGYRAQIIKQAEIIHVLGYLINQGRDAEMKVKMQQISKKELSEKEMRKYLFVILWSKSIYEYTLTLPLLSADGKLFELKGKTIDFTDQEYSLPYELSCYQYLVDQTIIQLHNGTNTLERKVTISRILNSGNTLINSHYLLKYSVFWMHLSLSFLIFITLSDLLSERKSGRRDFLITLGANGSLQTLSWIVKSFLIAVLIPVIFLIGLKIPIKGISIVNYTSVGVYLFFSIIYCFGIVSFMFLGSLLYSNLKLAHYFWAIIHMILQLPISLYIIDDYEKLDRNLKLALSFNPCMFLHFSFHLIAKYEILDTAFSFDNLLHRLPEDNVSGIELVMSSLISICIVSFMYLIINNYERIKLSKTLRFLNCARNSNSQLPPANSDNLFESMNSSSANITLQNISRYYGRKAALRNISIKIKENCITAFYGYSGCGKSTLMNILSGLDRSYIGEMFFRDYLGKKRSVSKNGEIGFCPPKLSLYSSLSIREHIKLAMNLKGVKCSEESMENLLVKYNIDKDLSELYKDLSKINQKKLCLLLALTGPTEILIIDEPTVGLKINQIRDIWKILNRERKDGKTIIIATHFLEEAEILSDTIAFMSEGVIKCYSSLADLEKKLDENYRLKITKDPFKIFNYAKINEFMNENMRDCSILEENSLEQIWTIPKENFDSLPKLIGFFEEDSIKDNIGFSHYVLKTPSIEDFFHKISNMESSMSLSSGSLYFGSFKKYSSAFIFFNHLNAMMMKRRAFFKRKPWTLFSSLIIANLFLILIAISSADIFRKNSLLTFRRLKRTTDIDIQPSRFHNAQHLIAYQRAENEDFTSFLYQSYRDFGIISRVEKVKSKAKLTSIILQSNDSNSDKKNNWKYETVFWIDEQDNIEIYYGSRYTLSRFFALNVLSNAFIKKNGQEMPIRMHFKTFEIDLNDNFKESNKEEPKFLEIMCHFNDWYYAVTCSICIGICIVISLIPSFILIIKEEIYGFKDTQILCGLSIRCYWLSNLLVDTIIASSPLLLIVPYTIYNGSLILSNASSALIILVFFYEIAFISFIHLTIAVLPNSFISSAIVTVLNIVVLIFFQNFSLLFWSEIIKWRIVPVPSIQYIYSLLHPSNSLTNGLIKLFNRKYCNTLNLPYFHSNLFGIYSDVITLIIQILVYQILILRIDYGSFKSFFKYTKSNRKNRKISKRTISREGEFQVQSEAVIKSASELQQNPKETVHNHEKKVKNNLRASIKKKAIVFNEIGQKLSTTEIGPLTLAVDLNDSLGILGKYRHRRTELLNMIVGKRRFSKGSLYVNGKNVNEDLANIYKEIDYIPACFPLLNELTLRETLTTIAQLCGYRNSSIYELVENILNSISSSDFGDFLIRNISKGRKKLLRHGISLLKEPILLLVDEPSVALDNCKKKIVWNLLSNFIRDGKTLIINTQNMEEYEILCNKCAIISNGHLICYGDKDFLIEHFTSGYKINLKLGKNHKTPFDIRLKSFDKQWASIENKKVCLKDNGNIEILLQSPSINWFEIFQTLKYCMTNYGIEHLSIQKRSIKDVRNFILYKEKEDAEEKSDPVYDDKM